MSRLDEHLKRIWEESADPPHYKEVFGFRRERCGEFLQQASSPSAALRKKAKPAIWDADPEASATCHALELTRFARTPDPGILEGFLMGARQGRWGWTTTHP